MGGIQSHRAGAEDAGLSIKLRPRISWIAACRRCADDRLVEQLLPVALKLASSASIEPISSDEARMDRLAEPAFSSGGHSSDKANRWPIAGPVRRALSPLRRRWCRFRFYSCTLGLAVSAG